MSRFIHKIKEKEQPLFWAVLAFFIPLILMWVGFACIKVFPFGKEQILVQDAWHQYYPFLVELRSKLINGESLFYTWNNGLGMNFLALAAYYLASPLNLLLLFLLRETASPRGGKLQTSNAIHSENEIIRQAQQFITSHIREKLSVPLVARSSVPFSDMIYTLLMRFFSFSITSSPFAMFTTTVGRLVN